jgi:hypothetical protein
MKRQSVLWMAAMFVVMSFFASGCIIITPDLTTREPIKADWRYNVVELGGFMGEGKFQQLLRKSVYDSGLARRFASDAPVRIEGRILDSGPSTSGGKVAWNVANTGLLLFFFGGPYLGSASATAEIRVYESGELVAEHQHRATSDWRVHYQVIPRIIDSRKRAVQRAEELAVWNAVEALATKDW